MKHPQVRILTAEEGRKLNLPEPIFYSRSSINFNKDAAEKLLIDAMSGSISARSCAQALWYIERQRYCPQNILDDLTRWNDSLRWAAGWLDQKPSEIIGEAGFKGVMKYHAIED